MLSLFLFSSHSYYLEREKNKYYYQLLISNNNNKKKKKSLLLWHLFLINETMAWNPSVSVQCVLSCSLHDNRYA